MGLVSWILLSCVLVSQVFLGYLITKSSNNLEDLNTESKNFFGGDTAEDEGGGEEDKQEGEETGESGLKPKYSHSYLWKNT
ncbi:hypothetical protein A0H76_2192 [Hepatospora eriocheir]|uniref:Uncharacterized protein n=1 Tax=Hepatospora eriocheir TaxID=1081669 RepID=A0A1X0QLK4_9MICR|nr:hypothetical protein A0H76_2192 [Hepatospora eriocheir]